MRYFPNLLSILYKTKLKEVHLIAMAMGLVLCTIVLGFLNDHLNTSHRAHLYLLQKANQELSYAHVWLDEFINTTGYSASQNNPTILNLDKAKQDLQEVLLYNQNRTLIKLLNKKQHSQLIALKQQLSKLKMSADICINTYIEEGVVPNIYDNHDREFSVLKTNINNAYNAIKIKLNGNINFIRSLQYLLLGILLIHIVLTVLVIKNIRIRLKERETRLEKTQNIAKLGFYTYNFNTKKWTVSKIILELLGYPKEGDIYKSWLAIVHPDDKKMVLDAFRQVKKPLDLIYRICVDADNSLRWIRHVSNPFKKNTKNTNPMVFGTIQDITEKRQLEHDFLHAFINAQEQEKQRFGEDLHDSISQVLSAESMYIDLLIKFDKKEDSKISEFLYKVRELNLNAINDARNIAHGLMSKQLKEKGLLNAIQQICTDYNHSKNIKFLFEQKGLDETMFSKETKINIFRICQEITTNTVRHSGATKATINMKKTHDDRLVLVIKDNGVGIDLEKLKSEKKGTGLKNIERRVKLLNGKLSLETKPEKGISYTITVPLT
ncbi:MAG: ATP-binding protein [Flavobacteriaceae bacterium]|nr:ATP-binding protein [Flavobacteriaceae bacterium]